MYLNILYPQGFAWEEEEVIGVVGLAEQLGLGASASLTSTQESSSSAFTSTLKLFSVSLCLGSAHLNP